MNKYDIVIFGGGISGLTVAHELLKYNLKIAVIEKESILGGMARSDIYPNKNNLRTEHSWRGYAPFYKNTFQIMKEIKLDKISSFDTLKPNINFLTVETNINTNKNNTLFDYIYIIYWIIYHFCSGYKRSEKNKEILFSQKLEKKISSNANKNYIQYIGPGLGLDPYSASLFHIGRYIEMLYFETKNNTNWYFTDRPTSEAWIDPWYTHLLNNGVDFYLSTELKELQFDENNVIHAKTSNKIFIADSYVIALNPYAVHDLYKNNKLGVDDELDKFNGITLGQPHIQISFRLGFNEKVIIQNRDAFVFSDSNLNITLYPQDNFWIPELFDTKINSSIKFPSLWSGTACIVYKDSKVYPGRRCNQLTINEFLEEVIYEISESKEFNNYLLKYNNKTFKELNMIEKEVWYEWEFKNNKLESRNKKWVNTINNSNRPLYKTHYNNLYITGAHCETGISIWSMESAVESGKRCALSIIQDKKLKNKIKLFKHSRPNKSLYELDDVLYDLKLPNILDIFIFVMSVIIILLILLFGYKYLKDKKIISEYVSL